MKKRMTYLLILSAMTLFMMPDRLKAQNPYDYEGQNSCLCDIEIGGDFLYWKPCLGDLHFALGGEIDADIENGELCIRRKYHHPDYKPGFRLYAKADNLLCGFGGALVYTHYNADAKSRVPFGISTVILPDQIGEIEGGVRSKWDFDYHTVEAVLGAPLQVSCNPCLDVVGYGGIAWISYCEKRRDRIDTDFEEIELTLGAQIKRDLDVWGVGPTMGVKTKYTLLDCLDFFGLFSTTLIVGEKQHKDRFRFSEDNENLFTIALKSNDACVCFPGMHFMAGLKYDMCICDMNLGLHIGWEYVHWINAPTFPFQGIRQVSTDRNLTLQGLFAGASLEF